MTERQKQTIRALLPFIGTIFIAGLAWQDLRHQVGESIPEQRFEKESLRTDASFRLIMNNQVENKEVLREINQRLLEVCVALRTGCR